MSEVTEIQPSEPEVAPTPAAPVEVPEQRFEWQPADEQGRPIGGRQVVKFRTVEELQQKMSEANTLLIRKLREETRKNRLGISEVDTIPDDAPRFPETLAFNPRVLSAEERIKISRDLLNPETFDEAADALLEAKIGAKPSDLSRRIAKLEESSIAASAKIEADAFVADNPEYVKCRENMDAITNWMMRYNLAPVKKNFQAAYNKLREDGVMILKYSEAPAVDPDPVSVVDPTPTPGLQAEPAPSIVDPSPVADPTPAPEVTPTPARIPTGLNRSNSDSTGVPRSLADEIVYEVVVNGQKRRFTGLAAINAMPSDEYRRRVQSDPNFAKKEQQLEREATERKRGRR